MEIFNRTSLIVGIIIGLILGLLLGMVLFWQVFPVKWTDANFYDLAPEAKAEYMALVADSYRTDRDHARVAKYLDGWYPEEKEQAMADAIQMYESQALPDKVQALKDLQLVLGIGDAAAAPPEPPVGLWERIRGMCMAFVIVLLVAVLGYIGYRVAARRRTAAPQQAAAVRRPPTAPRPEEWEGVGQPPLGHFFTTYKLGEDTYDESFSIETPMGEFLGECGVGISETVGTGEPDKVTALEVWLFDKSDIRTVTKVLMSENAYNDEAMRAKLASKGESVPAQLGLPFSLETSGLEVQVAVTELDYGEGINLPAHSFFSQLTVELVATAKPMESGASPF